MKIVSWNINGYNTVDRYGGFSQILKEKPSFICLQEVKVSDPEQLYTIFTSEYEHYYNFSSNKGHNGVYIYAGKSANRMITEIGMDRFDSEGRFLCLEYEDYYIVNVYMPHGGRDKQNLFYKLESYRYLIDFLSKIKKQKVFVMGDFNIASEDIDVERYKENRKNIMFTKEERDVFGRLLQSGYKDAYRLIYPNKREYSWWPYAYNARERNVGWRIDYFLITQKLEDDVEEVTIRTDIAGSDHCPLQLHVTERSQKLGRHCFLC